ncbi:MAG: hypothetical protein H6625_10625 [Bdellovibrionaceae bacterium]|nr:hypothetical protein [Pseudobdellovibrionaceae bacterium]
MTESKSIQHFIIFNYFVEGGYLAALSPSAVSVYLAIKVWTRTHYKREDEESTINRVTEITEDPTYPSYTKIMEKTKLSRGTIAKAIKELCAFNIISYVKGHSYKKANYYTLNPPKKWKEARPKIVQKKNQSKKRTHKKNVNQSEIKTTCSPDNKLAAVNKIEPASVQKVEATYTHEPKPINKTNETNIKPIIDSLAPQGVAFNTPLNKNIAVGSIPTPQKAGEVNSCIKKNSGSSECEGVPWDEVMDSLDDGVPF